MLWTWMFVVVSSMSEMRRARSATNFSCSCDACLVFSMLRSVICGVQQAQSEV